MTTISANTSMQDLKVTFQEPTLVFPSQQTQNKTLFLSNIDQLLNYHYQFVHLFHATPHFPPETVAERLKTALEKVLVQYDFMAGKLNRNHRSGGRLEIDCNTAVGAGFVVASSEFSLDEIGDLVCPNIGFRQLAVEKLHDLDEDEQPLCVFQVTSFRCGGFAIGMSFNHILLDGVAAKIFQENLASQMFDDGRPLPFIPCNDRRLLAARSPPQVTIPHPELLKVDDGAPFAIQDKELDFKILKLSPADVNLLKAKGAATTTPKTATTTFNVVAALLWRCTALSNYDSEENKDKVVSAIISTMDIRSRLNPPLPAEYCGNAVAVAYASAEVGHIEKGPFSKLVERVSEGVTRMSNEYVKSGIDWLEMNYNEKEGTAVRLFGDCAVSSWLRLGFDEVVFPWGKSVCCVPVVNFATPTYIMFSDGGGGVNVLVQRRRVEMESFLFHFHNFFKHAELN